LLPNITQGLGLDGLFGTKFYKEIHNNKKEQGHGISNDIYSDFNIFKATNERSCKESTNT